MPEGHIIRGTRGRSGATFAHWQIALAYAKYLSPEFHMWCNEVVREKMEGAPRRDMVTLNELAPEVRQVLGGIINGVVHKEMTEIIPTLVREHIGAEHYGVVRGLTAGDVLNLAGVNVRKGLRGLAGFVSNRLRRFCAERGYQVRLASLGSSTAYVFEKTVAREWLDSGGRTIIERKISERRGQTVLPLNPRSTI